MANDITVNFVEDGSKKLEQAFQRVGAAADDMDAKVRDSADSFDRVAESADTVDTRAMGFRDTLTGLQDGLAGIKAVNEGGLGLESLLLLGFGIGDLASGMSNFLAPALKSVAAGMKALNLTFLTSPITLIIAAVALLAAGFVLAYQKSETFRKIVHAALDGVKDAALAVANWFKGPFVKFFQDAWSKITGLPGKLKDAFAKVQGWISAPFKAAFNGVADAWNATVGRLSFSVPSWVPVIGGNGFDVPDIPKFHSGGVVPGLPGQEVLGLLQAGERVVPRGESTATTVNLHISGKGSFATMFLEAVRTGDLRLSVSGGRVQVA
ncbi:MAG TPA: hypothetical protein VF174_11440 [Micromonosporaceae bacterium]